MVKGAMGEGLTSSDAPLFVRGHAACELSEALEEDSVQLVSHVGPCESGLTRGARGRRQETKFREPPLILSTLLSHRNAGIGDSASRSLYS